MISTFKLWALAGTGLGLAASVFTAAVFLDLPLSTNASASDGAVEAPAVPVTVTIIKTRDVNNWQEFSGRLEAVNRIQIRSRVAGAIQSVDFREGSLVNAGDLLFTVDPAPY